MTESCGERYGAGLSASVGDAFYLNRPTRRIEMTAADPELQRLEPLVGTWTSAGHTEDSVLGPGVPTTSTETFSWLDGGYFFVSTYETRFGDEPAQTGINYWFHDADASRFRIIFFSNNGPFSEEGNRYEGQVRGNTLVFEGPARFEYRLADDGRIALEPDGTLTVTWWLRDEHGAWQPWMTNRFRRGAG
jgi:hypothetical protein